MGTKAKRAFVPPRSAIKAWDIDEPYLIFLKFYNKIEGKNTATLKKQPLKCNKITILS
ncbi:hypothetical protein GCM10011350_00590 [Marinomonas arctica]|nr:hypothetical protein GCM10011350_00590 [Marinomonas arctica]